MKCLVPLWDGLVVWSIAMTGLFLFTFFIEQPAYRELEQSRIEKIRRENREIGRLIGCVNGERFFVVQLDRPIAIVCRPLYD